ncbi:TIGR03087 family PEP-CTERM/XrtA system glycosyltransferase [Sphingomonas sp. CL5.1]|uniref:TIGR03087 family PEP-CTERM/XrtA system glycosyltransferase n=1 Tax=Sphingomonas sp. CL5.1 TaxID=2653203 RepID=UPI0015839289|nr:TIGR03087 family PEP-CTERM/XrtA system glycosyltransferase [Sphingomonas sp. CL5.1]QKS00024.1 TIGR03087 family PEP-CTERM/XrtA system glycosyltransferase [Sphingomonas sp. CL5.1]
MSEILFIAHRVPFPPDRGDKIRGFHVLRHLTCRARVHLVAFADDPRDLVPAPEYRALVDECVIMPRAKSRARAAIEALATAQPVSLTAFAHRDVERAVRDILARRPIDAIYVFSGQMAQYLPVAGPRAIMDFVDLDSAKFAAYAGDAHGFTRHMMRREARLLAAFEREVAGRVDASLFVSGAEAALLPGSIAIENGIDTHYYDPAARHVPVVGQGPLIVFTGQMDYRPNIDAVTWFARDILPRIPGARFAIVGRAPAPEVRALAGERVIVTGEVADVRGWLAAASVVVAPLKLARGVQNKVLEAMAMARPVVASQAAAEGIDHDGTIRVAPDADGFVAAVAALLADPAAARALGAAARARVTARYDWAAALAPLDGLLGLA